MSHLFLAGLIISSFTIIVSQEQIIDEELSEYNEDGSLNESGNYKRPGYLTPRENYSEMVPPEACRMVRPMGVCYAPYDGPFPVSIESRFDGFVWHHPQIERYEYLSGNWPVSHALTRAAFLDNSFTFSGYVKLPRYWFFKLGTVIGGGCGFLRRVGIDLQLGKYWPGWGAVRFGLFADELGIGADYWVIYRNRFKWLTTLEIATFTDRNFFAHDEGRRLRPSVKWLNRFFIIGNFYISAGVEHVNGLNRCKHLTQGFIGFGSTI